MLLGPERCNGADRTDALGSPVAGTDEVGALVVRTTYEPYGAALNRTVDGVGYSGQVMDAATGLVYMQQRYYDPAIGRFLSADPVQADANTGANLNRYAYAKDNPYRFTDPDGRFVCADKKTCPQVTATMNSAIKLIQKAAGNLSSSAKFTNKIAGAQLNNLVKFLKSDNAIVGASTSAGGDPGSTSGEAHQPVTMKLDIAGMKNTIQQSRYKSNPQNEVAAVVAHEGQHAEDVFNGKGPDNAWASYYVSETRAFTTQSYVNRGLGTGSAWGIWSPQGNVPGIDPAAQSAANNDCSKNADCQW